MLADWGTEISLRTRQFGTRDLDMSEKTEDVVAREYRKLADRYDERWAFYVEATLREMLRRMVPLARAILLWTLFLADGLRMGIRLTSASDRTS